VFACGHRQQAQASGARVATISRLDSIRPIENVNDSNFAMIFAPE
jgi:hypothetical protein